MANWREEENKKRAAKVYQTLVDNYVKTGSIDGASGRNSLGASANALWKENSPVAGNQLARYNAAGKRVSNEALQGLTGGVTWKADSLKEYEPEVARQGYLDMLSFINMHRNEGRWDVDSNSASVWSDDYLSEMLGAYPGLIEASEAKDAEWAATKDQKLADYEKAMINVWRWQELKDQGDGGYQEALDQWGPNSVQTQQADAKRWYNWLMADYLLGDQAQLFDFDAINAKYEAMGDEEYYAEEARLKQQYENLNWEALLNPEDPTYHSETEKLRLLQERAQAEADKRKELDQWRQIAEYDGLNSNIEGRLMQELEDYEPYAVGPDGQSATVYKPEYYTNQAYFINNASSNMSGSNILSSLKGRNIFAGLFDTDVQTVEGYLEKGYNYLLPEEIVIYNDLYLQDKAMAQGYLDSLESELLVRRREVQDNLTGLLATDPVSGGFMSVARLAAPIANMTQLGVQAIEGYRGTADPNAAYYDFLNAQGAITDAQRAAIMEKDKTGIAAFAYDAANNIGDVIVGLGLGPVGNQILMGSKAASASLQDSATRGIDGIEALARAGGDAAVEALSEKLGVDGTPAKGTKIFRQAAKDALGEGLEEVVSNVGSTLLDVGVSAVTGRDNALEEARKEYVIAGEANPEAKVLSDKMKEIGQDFAMGAVAGGVLGGVNAGVQKHQQRVIDRALKAAEKEAQLTTADKEAAEAAKVIVKKGSKVPTSVKMTYDDGNGPVKGEYQRFEKAEDGQLKVVIKAEDGTEKAVEADTITEAEGAGIAHIIKYSQAAGHAMSAQEASTMATAYRQVGGDAQDFVHGYEGAYLSGYAGITAPESSLPKNISQIAYDAGKAEAAADEKLRKARASKFKAVEAPVAGWLGSVQSNKQLQGLGDQEAISGALEGLTETQKATAEVAIEIGKNIGLNMVLYESDGESISEISNGMYDAVTHTVYIDVNTGANTGADVQAMKEQGTLGFAIMRTMGHEVTHYLENTESYGSYKEYVKNALKEKGESWVALMRGKLESAIKEGRKLTYEAAEAEVIADASEYMLQNSAFVQKMEKGLRRKVKTFIQGFMERIRTAFSNLVEGHRESAALRETINGVVRYTGKLQEMWDAMLEEIVQKREVQLQAAEMQEAPAAEAEETVADPQEAEFLAQEGVSSMEEFQAKITEESKELNSEEMLGRIGKSKRVQYSIRSLSDGTKYVHVDVDQQIFDGLQTNEYAKTARNYIRDHFRNKVIGTSVRAYVRRDSENEYTLPAKKNILPALYEGKMKAATELDNLLDASVFVGHEDDDGRHPDAVRGWDKYRTVFEVNGRYFEGTVALKKIQKGDVFYDVTKIKDITGPMRAKYSNELQYPGQGDVFNSIVSQSSDSVNTERKYSTRSSADKTEGEYSTRDLAPSISIRETLGAMEPTSRMTETERLLLKQYQEKLKVLQEKERAIDEQEKILKTAHGDDILKTKNRIKVLRAQANRASRLLTAAERSDGFAGMMATGRQMVQNYLQGSGGVVADAVDQLEEEISGLRKRLQTLGASVESAAYGQKAAFARGLFDQAQLTAAAQQLKDNYGSRMSVKTIADRLALAYGELYAGDGAEGAKAFSEEIRNLAEDLLRGNKYRYKSEILPMLEEKIGSISLSETDEQEIRNAGYTLGAYKRMLSPYIRVTENGSDLSSYASNAQYYGEGEMGTILGEETEGNLAMRLYDVISQEKAKEASIAYEGMSEGELIGMVMADIAGANLPMSTSDTTITYLRNELKKYAGESQEAAQEIEGALEKAKAATMRAGKVWRAAVEEVQTVQDVVEYYRKLEEQRRLTELAEQKQALTDQLKTEGARKLQEKVEEQRAEYREREQRAREYRRTRDEVVKLRNQISRDVKRLNNLRLRETDQKHVPQELQYMVDEVMRTFTESGLSRLAFSKEKTDSLIQQYDILRTLETDATYFWDDEIEQDLQQLSALSEQYTALTTKADGSPSYYHSLEGVELEQEILRSVQAIIGNVMNMVNRANQTFIEGNKETFATYANAAGKELMDHEDVKRHKGKRGELEDTADEWLRTGNMTPVYFFRHLKNKYLQEVFDQIRKGQRKYGQIIREGQAYVQEQMEKYHYDAWADGGKLKMKTSQGHEITLTREQAMWVYATAKREEANKLYQTQHLLVGGFQYKDLSEVEGKEKGTRAKDKPHSLDKADVEKISGWLTEEQKAYADAMVKYLSERMADYGNEAAMDMFGYKKFLETYYFPFQTKASQRVQRGDEGPQGESSGTGRVKNAGFTKKLTHSANTTLVMDDFTKVITDHIQQMATYSSMVQPIENLKRLLNHKMIEDDGTINTIRAMIGQKYGTASEAYLNTLLKDLNGAVQGDQRAIKGPNKLIGAFKRGAVLASASVVLQQPTAMARAMAYVNPKYFAVNPLYRPSKGTWETMMKHSGTAVIKDMGKFDVGLGMTASQYMRDEHLNAFETWRRLKGESKTKAGQAAMGKAIDWLTSAPGKADQWTWGIIWKAVENEQAAMHPEMDRNSDAFLDMVGARFDDVIDLTQVYDSVLTRSNLMRSKNALHQMATSFMSEPTLSLNMLYDAVKGDHSSKAKRVGIIASVAASQVLAGAMAALVQAWNDDKDKRNFAEKYADAALGNILDNLNPLGMVPYISDIVSILQGYDVERADMSVISTLSKYTLSFANKVINGETLTLKDWENFAGNWANLTGIPAKNIMREIRRTINAVTNTQWNKPSASNLGFVAKEALPWYSGKNTAYYERAVAAELRGDTAYAEDLREYMLTSKMVTEDKLTEGLQTAMKNTFIAGDTDEDTAIAYLVKIGAKDDADEAYWEVDKWKEMRDTGIKAGDYRKYSDFFQAVETGENLKAVIQEYLDHGVEKSTLASQITNQYKEQYVALYKAGKRGELANLQARILTAYQVLGYDRSEKLKDVQKWIK